MYLQIFIKYLQIIFSSKIALTQPLSIHNVIIRLEFTEIIFFQARKPTIFKNFTSMHLYVNNANYKHPLYPLNHIYDTEKVAVFVFPPLYPII